MATKYPLIRFLFFLYFILYFPGCTSISKTDLIQQMGWTKPCCGGFQEFAFEKALIGSEVKFNINTNSPVAKFSEGISYFKAFELPKVDSPHYVIIKSFLISKSSDPFFFPASFDLKLIGDPADPYVFPPLAITLDEDFNIARRIEPDSFQMAADFKLFCFFDFGGWASYLFRMCGPSSGSSRLQTAIRLTKDSNEKYLVIATTPDIAKGYRKFPDVMFAGRRYWPLGTYSELRRGVDYLPIGKLSLAILRPEEIFRNIDKQILDFPVVQPSQKLSTKWFSVNAPNIKAYHFSLKKDHIILGRLLPDGSAIILEANWWTAPTSDLSWGSKSDIIQLKREFNDVSYKYSESIIQGVRCRRTDYSGKNRHMFLAPIEGYDIRCSLQVKDGEDWVWVRIGGNMTYGLEVDKYELPNELERFASSLRLLGDK